MCFATSPASNLPRTSEEISRIDAQDVRRGDLASGDIVLFGRTRPYVTHVGIYVGEGRFVHAPNEGGTVRLDYLDGAYWTRSLQRRETHSAVDHFFGAGASDVFRLSRSGVVGRWMTRKSLPAT